MAPLLVPFLLYFLLIAHAQNIIPKAEFVLGKKLPDITLIDEEGRSLKLSQVADGKPLLLSFIYTRCTSACPMIVEGIKKALSEMGSRDIRVLLIDFDERDKPTNLKKFRKERSIYDSRWTLALVKGEELKKISRAVDFKYFYDEKTDMFAHPNVLIVVSPDLIVSGYILGLSYDADRLSVLIEKARVGQVAVSPIKSLLLKCFRYDPITGTYFIDWSFVAMIVGGLIPIAGMFYFIVLKNLLPGLRRAV